MGEPWDRNTPSPERTEEMIRNGQVWVWLWDVPRSMPSVIRSLEDLDPEPGATGRWEVRGTGARFDDERADEGARETRS